MFCIKTEIPKEICDIDDELKAIYHSQDTVCIWIFKSRKDRNSFMDETAGMRKDERENHLLNSSKLFNAKLVCKAVPICKASSSALNMG